MECLEKKIIVGENCFFSFLKKVISEVLEFWTIVQCFGKLEVKENILEYSKIEGNGFKI